jgi:hypothetical protein
MLRHPLRPELLHFVPGFRFSCAGAWIVAAVGFVGCASPYHADRGALMGGALGAGTGALIGDAVGSPLAGAAIGAGVGALSGAAIGGGLDDIEARNRAEIQARLGHQIPPGAVTIGDVMAMTQAGVEEPLIVSHIQANGAARPLTSQDLIQLRQAGVSPAVIQQLQTARPPVMARSAPPPYPHPPPAVVIEEYHYGPPVYYRYPRRYYGPPPGPRASWGFSYSHVN